eukprot:gnl/MRDRNA2_/MRDRNA2_226506_c0_seq1.p1 gnl/MRDRNA2_/MRDRNA2_226506_c0~~gnl/MRDRNA2_/MRDRNA2_226506_c0_seq1.p1  ORF type:complete len:181 (+),score=14.05 gnl/MRDRNA2_/MRDRNA2_226506_c0_seq1:3-545(+)
MAGNVCSAFEPSDKQDTLEGILLCVVGAVMYSFYTVSIRLWVPEDGNLSLFFGFLGLMTISIIGPVILTLHLTGLHTMPTLTFAIVGWLAAKGLLDNVLSNYLWATAVLWTTPTVATVGLTLTIPLAVVADLVTGQLPATGAGKFWSCLSGSLVILGFLLINLSSLRHTRTSDERLTASP